MFEKFGRMARMVALVPPLIAGDPAAAKQHPANQIPPTVSQSTDLQLEPRPNGGAEDTDKNQEMRDSFSAELNKFEDYFKTHWTVLAVDKDVEAGSFVREYLHIYGMNVIQDLTSAVGAIADETSFQNYVLQTFVLKNPNDFEAHKDALERMSGSVSALAKAWMREKTKPQPNPNDAD